ncbi:MAG TPA: serine protease [Armatimonadota bacterium]|jgi:hypothetical protein
MPFRLFSLLAVLGLLATVLLPLSPARADEVAQAGRTTLTRWKDAIITLKVAAKITTTAGGQDSAEEIKQEAAGTFIDPSGLILASLTSVDIVEAYTSMMGGEDVKVTGNLTGIKAVLADGTELDAKLVLRDKDLDLAFLRLVKKSDKPFPALDLTKTTQPDILDQVFILYRLGTVGNRVMNISPDRVQALIEKPRKGYVLGIASYAAEVGAPVFGMDGNLTGILLRKIQGSKSGDDRAGLYVVLPAADIAEAATQAPATADIKDAK